MTRDEAIAVLNMVEAHGSLVVEAKDMAIKALEIVEEFEKAQIISSGRLNGRTYAYKCGLEDGKRKALEQEGYYKCLAQSYERTIVKLTEAIAEQQPSDDKVTITMNKGTLKYSNREYVIYNKDWFRKHFATEVEIITGYDGYIKQPTSEDCVSRQAVLERINDWWGITSTSGEPSICDYIRELPPVAPAVKAIPLDKVKQAREEITKQFVDLQDGSEEWRSYVNETVLECVEILDKLIAESEEVK